jgi:phototropin
VNNLAGILADIHKTFVSEQSRKQVNVPGDLMEAAHNDMKSLVTDTLPSMESMFDGMQQKIEQLLFDDIYPRFVRHQVTMETARSLTSDRQRYQGLGDCFCLSSPS